MTLYLTLARLTVLCYAAMAVAAWRAGEHKTGVVSACFAVCNAVIFLWRSP